MAKQAQGGGGGAEHRDLWAALNDVTKAINALGQQITASDAQFASVLTLTGPMVVSAAAYTMSATDTSIIAAGTATLTLTLLAASTVTGRLLFVKNTVAFAINSAAANVIPLVGGAASTAIVSAAAGKWAILSSDGNNWQIMAAN